MAIPVDELVCTGVFISSADVDIHGLVAVSYSGSSDEVSGSVAVR